MCELGEKAVREKNTAQEGNGLVSLCAPVGLF